MPSSPLLFPSLPCSALALTFSSVSPTPPATNKFDYVALRARRFPSPPSPCMPRPPSPVVAGYLSMPKGRAEPSGAAGAGAMDTGTYSLFPFFPSFLVAALLRARSHAVRIPARRRPPEKSILPPTHV